LIEIEAIGWDEIDRVELIKNNRGMERFYPQAMNTAAWPSSVRCRIEFGWGAWGNTRELAVTPWNMTLVAEEARILKAMPCFRSRPFLADECPGVTELTEGRCSWKAHTAQRFAVEGIQCFESSNAQGIAFEIAGRPDSRLVLMLSEPEERAIAVTLAELAERTRIEPAGRLRGEAVVLHRLVAPGAYTVQAATSDTAPSRDRADFYYVRVTQANGQMAWTSPIWVEAE
jgi:hypothetical protein